MLRKGVSPVIATILLIAIVIVLAGIVFIWARGFVAEGIQKRGEPVERACESVSFEASVVQTGEDYMLEIDNRANIPLYGFDVKILGEGEVSVHTILDQSIDIGSSVQIEDLPASEFSGVEKIVVIPIILGTKGDAPTPYSCPDQFGVGVSIL